MYQSFHRLFRKNYHKTACSVLQFKHLDILIWIYSHIQDAWFVEFSVLSFSYIQIHFSYFGIHTNVPSHICISHNQGVPVLEITSFSFTSFVIPSRKFPVLSFPVSCRYLRTKRRGPRTPSLTTDTSLDCVFVKNTHFSANP